MTNPPEELNRSEIIFYQTEDAKTRLQVRLENETVWLTQAAIAELFQTTPQNITLHLRNIYEEGELAESGTCKDFLQVQDEGSRRVHRSRKFYNLDEIEGLDRIVVMYLDYAEDQARRRRLLFMRDWREKLDAFLKFNERDILEHAGKVSMEVSQALALEEYEKFERRRLAEEAEREALEDDAELRRVAKMIEDKPRKGKKNE